jgi:peptidyl-tRNA hydrolase, PTH2 family
MPLAADRVPPSMAAVAIASAIVAGLFGFFLGQFSTLGNVTNKVPSPSSSDSSDDEFNKEYALAGPPTPAEDCKLVLVVRTDLGMTKGPAPLHERVNTVLTCLL